MRNLLSRAVVLAVLSSTIAGCTALTIRNAADTPAHPAPGTVPPLKSYLEGSPKRTVVILVHGVGDHCPTYGLDPKKGWLNDTTAAALGLHPTGPVSTPEVIADPDSRTAVGIPDPGSAFYLTRRSYSYQRTDGTQTAVEVGEITWSGVTAWLKAKQLSFDITDNVPGGDSSIDTAPHVLSCPEIAAGPYPFARQVLNKSLKEQLLDLALSDAILYAGTYGAKLEHGLAEMLCRLVSDGHYDQNDWCRWRDVSDAALSSRFVFMTHSLGSRIVYDTLIDLAGQAPTRAGGSVFDDKDAVVKVRSIVANTSAVYMFANQLPLLGLANVPITRRSDQDPNNYLQILSLPDIAGPLPEQQPPAPPRQSAPASDLCTENRIACLAALKHESAASLREAPGRLDIMAFSDPNDLLSWPIPRWYLQDTETLNLQITNITLQNAFHWLGLVEWPTSAHDDYMTNSTVWKVVKCGATNGKTSCH